ncbi:unnamed protein product [Sympodiomycopsis kandeliae]
MSDYPSSLRPPSSSAGQSHSMGSAPIGRAASPGIGHNSNTTSTSSSNQSSRYSLGGGMDKQNTSSSRTNSMSQDQMFRKAQNDTSGLRSPGLGSMNLGNQSQQQQQQPPSASAGRFGPRPSSEMLGMGALGSAALHHQSYGGAYGQGQQHHFTPGSAGLGSGSGDNEAIDKWFEDLQHYEATLEEMAAASLDQNFKEELSAIEQWFRVLSEAERTAALYSLLQESTQVQIRFFITVLQQMARSDPMSAFLGQGINNPMAEQMEAKLASLGLKSPSAAKSPASPGNPRGYQRQSEAYLSPNHASMNFGSGGDAAATLAAQRAKLKANRVSAPGTFTGDQRTFSGSGLGGGLDQVQEREGTPSGSGTSGDTSLDQARSPGLDGGMRPKSIDALSKSSAPGGSSGGPPRSPRRSGPLDSELSPIVSGGNWASMVNTPLTNMFDDPSTTTNNKGTSGQANVNLDAASSQLASVAEGGGGGGSASGIMLDPDVSKYQRRKSGQPGYDQGQNQHNVNSSAGGLSPNLAAGWAPGSSNDFLRQAMAPSPGSNNQNQFANFPTMSPNSFAGLQSPSGGFGNGMNMQMMNAMAAMGGLNNANAAQFLAMQQQILQNQQQIAAMAAAAQQGGNNNNQQQQFNRSRQGLSPPTHNNPLSSGRRSPAPGAGRGGPAASKPSGAQTSTNPAGAGGGAGADEEVPDLSVLNDIPAWLRHLRLHKYTPNFESSNWKDMVVMSDADLEAKGVAALGARRKLLKTFRAVREKHEIKGKDDLEKPGDGAGAIAGSANGPTDEANASINPSSAD